MDVVEVVETEDQLEVTGMPKFMRGFIRARLAKPFYFRWRSEICGAVDIEGEQVVLGGETIHEQMLLRGMHQGSR